MWGSGVDDHNTIPAHFNALHQDYRAYNHGQSGFVSRQGLARLVNLVNQKSPMDVIVFYDGCNDSLSLCDPDVSINGHREQENERQIYDTFFYGSLLTLLAKTWRACKSLQQPFSTGRQTRESPGGGSSLGPFDEVLRAFFSRLSPSSVLACPSM